MCWSWTWEKLLDYKSLFDPITLCSIKLFFIIVSLFLPDCLWSFPTKGPTHHHRYFLNCSSAQLSKVFSELTLQSRPMIYSNKRLVFVTLPSFFVRSDTYSISLVSSTRLYHPQFGFVFTSLGQPFNSHSVEFIKELNWNLNSFVTQYNSPYMNSQQPNLLYSTIRIKH